MLSSEQISVNYAVTATLEPLQIQVEPEVRRKNTEVEYQIRLEVYRPNPLNCGDSYRHSDKGIFPM